MGRPVRKVVTNFKNKDVHEVDHIIGITRAANKVHCLIKWKGWSIRDSTWEPIQNCKDSAEELLPYQDFIEHVKKSLKQKPVPEERDGPKDNGEFEVDDIVGIYWGIDKRGLMFTVKWKGWPHTNNTEEPLKNVENNETLEPFLDVVDHVRKLGETVHPPPVPRKGKAKAASVKAAAAKKSTSGRRRSRKSESVQAFESRSEVFKENGNARNGDFDSTTEDEATGDVSPKKRSRLLKKSSAKKTKKLLKTKATPKIAKRAGRLRKLTK